MRGKQFIAAAETPEMDVLITPWSVVHFGVGGAAAQIGMGFWWFQLLHVAYEMKDNILTQRDDSEYYNSTYNSVGDHIIATLGFWVGRTNKNWHWKTLMVASYGTLAIIGDQVG